MDNKKVNPYAVLFSLIKDSMGKFVQSIIFAIIGVASGVVPFLIAAKIIIALINGEKDIKFYGICCLIIVACYVVKVLFSNISTTISHNATYLTLKNIREKMITKLSKVSMGTLENTASGQLKDTIVDRVEGLETSMAHLIPEMTANILIPICLIVYLFILDWRMALLTLAVFPLAMVFISTMGKTYPAKFKESVRINKTMNDSVVEYINGIEVIKTFNQSAASYEKYENAVVNNASYFYNWMKSCQWPMSSYTSICPATLLTVLPMGCVFFMNGTLSITDFITVIVLSVSIMGPLITASNFVDSIAGMSTVMNLVNDLLEEEELVRPEIDSEMNGCDIKMKDVHFSYKENEEVLKGINLEIKKGSVTALVGPSGSGKSTIAKLIAGFWDVKDGEITIGERNIKELSQSQLSETIAYVSQDNFLFNDTIMNNVRVGKKDASDTEVIEACKKSGCDDFIRKLDNGYETVVGSSGSHLSGGERQRIAIARAMLHDSPIVIMDEATAYTDPENEKVIQESVSKLIENKTLIVIAHRLSTITDSDNIVVVSNGEIVKQGTHEDLLKNCPLYESMWKAHIGARDGE